MNLYLPKLSGMPSFPSERGKEHDEARFENLGNVYLSFSLSVTFVQEVVTIDLSDDLEASPIFELHHN